MDSLESQSPDRPVYRSVGNLLLEVNDREILLRELTESKINIDNHLKILIEKEQSLRNNYEELVAILESK